MQPSLEIPTWRPPASTPRGMSNDSNDMFDRSSKIMNERQHFSEKRTRNINTDRDKVCLMGIHPGIRSSVGFECECVLVQSETAFCQKNEGLRDAVALRFL